MSSKKKLPGKAAKTPPPAASATTRTAKPLAVDADAPPPAQSGSPSAISRDEFGRLCVLLAQPELRQMCRLGQKTPAAVAALFDGGRGAGGATEADVLAAAKIAGATFGTPPTAREKELMDRVAKLEREVRTRAVNDLIDARPVIPTITLPDLVGPVGPEPHRWAPPPRVSPARIYCVAEPQSFAEAVRRAAGGA